MATRAQWIEGARPRTLPVSIAPVLVGTGAAIAIGAPVALVHGYAPLTGQSSPDFYLGFIDPSARSWLSQLVGSSWSWAQLGQALLAVVVALALQVGVNYANDYSDGIRGTDDERVGPFRLVGSGAASPSSVKQAAFICFAVAAVAGFALVAWTGHWWLIAVGVACIAAAWYYTGGRRPYGYAGLGEVSVFIFFGLVAVLGTTYTQSGTVSWPAVVTSIGMGALACAVLVVNNLRDVPTDAESGKVTAAVRIGDVATRQLYVALIITPAITTLMAAAISPGALLGFLAAPLAITPIRTVVGGATGRELLPVLRDTGRLELVIAVLLMVGLAL
jgi:1,4-dihydroxy-2-naphthoate polyprenyltransferase